MKLRKISAIETPYTGISHHDYEIEKHRLQLELLKIQNKLIRQGQGLAIVFEGRDAAGKGSTIKRFTEHLNSRHFQIVELGIPSRKESKYWFRRYEKKLPKPGRITFFDRSWYSRAMIEPTMGYCSEQQYRYFMKKVLPWEHRLLDSGTLLVKFYLSINREAQLYRFEDRLNNPLTFWKFSKNDLHVHSKWKIFTQYKEQMFAQTSSIRSPWVIVNANRKIEGRLTAMLHLVRLLGDKNFIPLTGEDVTHRQSIKIKGIEFSDLSFEQFKVLNQLVDEDSYLKAIEPPIKDKPKVG